MRMAVCATSITPAKGAPAPESLDGMKAALATGASMGRRECISSAGNWLAGGPAQAAAQSPAAAHSANPALFRRFDILSPRRRWAPRR